MLLSFPNWIIHLSSSLEWGVAAALFFRYGKLTRRRDLRMFGLAMLPHWAGSFFVLAYHVSGDTIPFLLDMSELINLFGSTALLLATLNLLKSTKPSPAVGYTAALAAIMISGKPQSWMGADIFDAILQLSSVVYLTFLVLLVKLYRRDPELFPALSLAGFWFVVVFISVTVFCMYLATKVRGYPTLSHDDLLHGLAESLLTVSNLMIVIGVHRKIREVEQGERRELPTLQG